MPIRARIRILVGLLVCLMMTPSLAPASPPSDRLSRVPERLLRFQERLLRPNLSHSRGQGDSAFRSSAQFYAENFRVVGHSKLKGGPPWGDVWFYDYGGDLGKYAFVGTWQAFGCKQHGIQVVDVNDPTNPQVVAVIGSGTRIAREDIVVQRIDGRDILAVGTQRCGFSKNTRPVGLKLFDVSDPSHPARLGFLRMEKGVHGVHELDLVVRDDGQALALLAVPFAEFDASLGEEAKGEFRIVDVSDPANPIELSDWGVIGDSSLHIFGGNDEISNSLQGLGAFPDTFAHGARAADGGTTAYVSYWDAGVLKFDISDPSNPVLVGRTRYSVRDDGDAHSMTPFDSGGTHYILQNDEDGSTLPSIRVTSSANSTPYQAQEQYWAPTLLSRGSGLLTGRAHDAGGGCLKSAYEGAAGKVVLIDHKSGFYGARHPCHVGVQVLQAVRAGAKAVLLNMIWPEDPNAFFPFPKKPYKKAINKEAKGVPILQITDIDEVAGDIRSGLQNGPVKVTLKAEAASNGFLRIFSEDQSTDIDSDGTPEYEQVGSFYDLPHVRGEYKTPPGFWTIHNTEVLGDRSYSSWYSHGVVALDLTDPSAPELVGQFVPPRASVWGVTVDPETGLIYVSDIGGGLWIVEPTGEAAAR